MTWWQGVLITAAGLWAGMINTVVGSGTLVTFPVLVALGYPPVTATTSNAIGLISGTIAGTYGYRHELAGQRDRLVRYAVASLLGAIGGAMLLLSLPHGVFEVVVPALIGIAVVLVVAQPWLVKRLRPWTGAPRSAPLLYVLIFLVGVYGGYFTAAQGVLLVGVMGLLVADSLQRLNAFKNALAAVVNVVAGAIYAVIAPINWPVVAVLAVSSTFGALAGAKIGRKLRPTTLRVVIAVIGVAAIARFLTE